MQELVHFMNTPAGRIARVIVGIAFIVVGVLLGKAWITLAVAGLIPLATGTMNVCLLAPFAHRSIRKS